VAFSRSPLRCRKEESEDSSPIRSARSSRSSTRVPEVAMGRCYPTAHPDTRPFLVAICPSTVHAHTVAHVQVTDVVLVERILATIAIAHGDPVVVVAGVALLDVIADRRAAHRTGDGRRGVAATAADLVAEHAARDPAEHRAGAGRMMLALHDVDPHDLPAHAVLGHRLVVP